MTALAVPTPATSRPPRGWPRAAALLGIAMATAVVQPSVLVGVPFLVLGVVLGVRGWGLAAAAVALAVALGGGARDALWYAERGWALLAGAWFAALTVRHPSSTFSSRALGAVAGAAGVAALLLGLRSGAWRALEWAVEDRLGRGMATAMEALRLLGGGGDALPPALATAVQETVQTQAQVFPALLGISSLAGMGVAWWVYVRLSTGSDQGVGPLRDFRFNDHLVWVFIGGLLLLLTPWEEVLARVGANAVVFMGALYALRGAAVILFLSGGLSLFGYVMLAFGLVLLPPLVLTGAMVVGIGDTWLDVRSRARSTAA